MMNSRKTIYAVAVLIIQFCATLPAADSQPQTVFEDYLKAIVEERWEDAEKCWRPEIVALSGRLGIVFKDVAAKYDCASPVMKYLGAIRDGLVEVAVTDAEINGDWAGLEVQLSSSSDTLTTQYYTGDVGDGWKLTSPLYLFTGDWPKRDTRFARIYFSDETRVNQFAIDELDKFIEDRCRLMGLDDDRIRRLEDIKMDYFLCGEDEIAKLTGFDTHGMGILPFDAVVTIHLPHEHEVTHLLVNYALQEAPLYTLPFMQEGLASYLGGRWGRSSEVILYTGHMSLAYEFCELDDILTSDDFRFTIGNPDISYPISALFGGYLMENGGWDEFIKLYLALSGTSEEVVSFDAPAIRETISSAHGMSWKDIKSDFETYWKKYKYAGIVPVGVRPDQTATVEVEGNGLTATVWESGQKYIFEIGLAEESNGGVLLFTPKGEKAGKGYRSRLFADHLPEREYISEHFGLNFSPAEVGLYDYYRDKLAAKFITSLAEEDKVWDGDTRILRFSLDRKFIPYGNLKDLDITPAGR